MRMEDSTVYQYTFQRKNGSRHEMKILAVWIIYIILISTQIQTIFGVRFTIGGLFQVFDLIQSIQKQSQIINSFKLAIQNSSFSNIAPNLSFTVRFGYDLFSVGNMIEQTQLIANKSLLGIVGTTPIETLSVLDFPSSIIYFSLAQSRLYQIIPQDPIIQLTPPTDNEGWVIQQLLCQHYQVRKIGLFVEDSSQGFSTASKLLDGRFCTFHIQSYSTLVTPSFSPLASPVDFSKDLNMALSGGAHYFVFLLPGSLAVPLIQQGVQKGVFTSYRPCQLILSSAALDPHPSPHTEFTTQTNDDDDSGGSSGSGSSSPLPLNHSLLSALSILPSLDPAILRSIVIVSHWPHFSLGRTRLGRDWLRTWLDQPPSSLNGSCSLSLDSSLHPVYQLPKPWGPASNPLCAGLSSQSIRGDQAPLPSSDALLAFDAVYLLSEASKSLPPSSEPSPSLDHTQLLSSLSSASVEGLSGQVHLSRDDSQHPLLTRGYEGTSYQIQSLSLSPTPSPSSSLQLNRVGVFSFESGLMSCSSLPPLDPSLLAQLPSLQSLECLLPLPYPIGSTPLPDSPAPAILPLPLPIRASAFFFAVLCFLWTSGSVVVLALQVRLRPPRPLSVLLPGLLIGGGFLSSLRLVLSGVQASIPVCGSRYFISHIILWTCCLSLLGKTHLDLLIAKLPPKPLQKAESRLSFLLSGAALFALVVLFVSLFLGRLRLLESLSLDPSSNSSHLSLQCAFVSPGWEIAVLALEASLCVPFFFVLSTIRNCKSISPSSRALLHSFLFAVLLSLLSTLVHYIISVLPTLRDLLDSLFIAAGSAYSQLRSFLPVYSVLHSSQLQSEKERLDRLLKLPLHKAILDHLEGEELTHCYLENRDTAQKTDLDGRTALDLVMLHLDSLDIDAQLIFYLLSDYIHSHKNSQALPLWAEIVQSSHPSVVRAVKKVLEKFKYDVEVLSKARDKAGRKAKDIASPPCKDLIIQMLFLFRRFEIRSGPREYSSDTSIVVFAIDHLDSVGLAPLEDQELDKSSHYSAAPSVRRKTRGSVALKFMKNRSDFSSMLRVYLTAGFSEDYVPPLLASFDPQNESDPRKMIEAQQFEKDASAKGFDGFPFCLVMQGGEMSLKRMLDQQAFAGRDWDLIRQVVKQIASAVDHVHKKGFVHGDIKPANIVLLNRHFKLIDLDSAADWRRKEAIGARYSSAFVPPEFLFMDDFTFEVFPRTFRRDLAGHPILDSEAPFSLLPADPSFDLWSLGCLVFLLCTGTTMYQAGIGDHLCANDDLLEVLDWDHSACKKKLEKVPDRFSKNLVSLLLNRDPRDRLPPIRILCHPFLTGKQPARLQGELPEYEVFLSYRVNSDLDHAEAVYNALTAEGMRVWWDKKCLQPGVDWEAGFCDGLLRSACFLCLLSRNAINNPSVPSLDLSNLRVDSQDNVLLEWRMALELRERGFLQRVLPVLIGDKSTDPNGLTIYSNYRSSNCHPLFPTFSLPVLETQLKNHFQRQGLGPPTKERVSVRELAQTLDSLPCVMVEGSLASSLHSIVRAVKHSSLRILKSEDTFAGGSRQFSSPVRTLSVLDLGSGGPASRLKSKQSALSLSPTPGPIRSSFSDSFRPLSSLSLPSTSTLESTTKPLPPPVESPLQKENEDLKAQIEAQSQKMLSLTRDLGLLRQASEKRGRVMGGVGYSGKSRIFKRESRRASNMGKSFCLSTPQSSSEPGSAENPDPSPSPDTEKGKGKGGQSALEGVFVQELSESDTLPLPLPLPLQISFSPDSGRRPSASPQDSSTSSSSLLTASRNKSKGWMPALSSPTHHLPHSHSQVYPEEPFPFPSLPLPHQ